MKRHTRKKQRSRWRVCGRTQMERIEQSRQVSPGYAGVASRQVGGRCLQARFHPFAGRKYRRGPKTILQMTHPSTSTHSEREYGRGRPHDSRTGVRRYKKLADQELAFGTATLESLKTESHSRERLGNGWMQTGVK